MELDCKEFFGKNKEALCFGLLSDSSRRYMHNEPDLSVLLDASTSPWRYGRLTRRVVDRYGYLAPAA